MKKFRNRFSFAARGALILLLLLPALFIAGIFGGGEKTVRAAGEGSSSLAVEKYEVNMSVASDRKISVRESITVRFLRSGLTMFYRSLPVDQGDEYFDFSAECPGNEAFSWYVASNPDTSGFIDVNCVGNAYEGARWTYHISYTMISSSDEVKDGMLLDVIGAGWPVELNDVTINISFPGVLDSYDVYSGGFGSTSNKYVEVTSVSGKRLSMHAERLPIVYNDTYGESMAAAVTLRFSLGGGALAGYTASRIFTSRMGWILLAGIAAVAAAFGASLIFKKRREIIPVVGLKAPKDMDPLRMGKLIDGKVNDEDIVSMIYWFASKGWLFINLEKEDDPVLMRRADLPENIPSYQRTLFEGLFGGMDSVRVSFLENKFYKTADKVRTLVDTKDIVHFERRSEWGLILGGVFAVLLFFFSSFFSSLGVGGGYKYWFSWIMVIPVVLVGMLLRKNANYRYKKNKRAYFWSFVPLILLAAVITVLYMLFMAKHLLNPWEKLAVGIFAWGCLFIGLTSLSPTKEYAEILGEILGFKEFITVTESDRIKFMLEENPELFYDVLPYAQVLGVTKEWEDKFKDILLEAPSWYIGSGASVFDYMIFSSCLRHATSGMMSRPQSSIGSGVGRSGGGGHFGGFSGGGHGGGGGGAR